MGAVGGAERWMPGMRDGVPRVLLGTGWLLALGALGHGAGRLAADLVVGGGAGPAGRAAADTLHAPAAVAAPWLLIGALALTAASLLAAL